MLVAWEERVAFVGVFHACVLRPARAITVFHCDVNFFISDSCAVYIFNVDFNVVLVDFLACWQRHRHFSGVSVDCNLGARNRLGRLCAFSRCVSDSCHHFFVVEWVKLRVSRAVFLRCFNGWAWENRLAVVVGGASRLWSTNAFVVVKRHFHAVDGRRRCAVSFCHSDSHFLARAFRVFRQRDVQSAVGLHFNNCSALFVRVAIFVFIRNFNVDNFFV